MKINIYELVIIWTIVGFFAGCIPLVFGFVKKKVKYGVLGLVSSTIGGFILGIYLIIPAVIVFMWLIFRKNNEGALDTPNDVDIS